MKSFLCPMVLLTVASVSVMCAASTKTTDLSDVQARYRQWERPIQPESKLARLKPLLERKYGLLPPHDLDDRSPLPLWFRVYWRLEHTDLRTSGPDQYGREAARRTFQALLDDPNSPDLDDAIERLQRNP
jgi:hypothetical protein